MVVVGIKFGDKVLSEALEVSDLFVVCRFFRLQKVNENSVFTARGAVLSVVELEVLFKLFVQESLEFVLIVDRDHTVVEDSQDLVAPKLDQVLFGILVGLLSLIKTSEHFADVSHVEHVVGALGRGKELLRNVVKKLNRSNGKRLADSLDLIREVVELELGEVTEDLFQILLRWVGVLDYVEVAHDAVGDVLAATTGLAHCCHQLHVANVVLDDLRAVVPEAVVHVLTNELDWRLGAEFVLHRHVQVINDTDSF